MTTEIALKKIQVVQDILNLNDEQTLISIEHLLQQLKIKKQLPKRMTVEEFETRITQSERDFENGQYKDVQLLMKKYT